MIGHLFRCVATNTYFVTVQIAKISAIIVRMIFRPQPWAAFIFPACGNGQLVATIHLIARRGIERHHMPIARRGQLTVQWFTQQKQGAINAFPPPPGPATINIKKFAGDAQRFKDLVIKLGC